MPKKFTKLTKPKKRLAAKALCAGIVLGVFMLWIVSYARSGNPYNLFQVITMCSCMTIWENTVSFRIL